MFSELLWTFKMSWLERYSPIFSFFLYTNLNPYAIIYAFDIELAEIYYHAFKESCFGRRRSES